LHPCFIPMKTNKVNREEYKYFVSNDEIIYLRSMLGNVMNVDPNSKNNKQYTVTSLYFDTPLREDLEEKQSGIYYREKFRLRKYNSENKVIKFESKKRANTAIIKDSEIISYEDTDKLINGNYDVFKKYNSDFLIESYIKLKSRGYRPTTIVEYDREAYFLPFGNIRLTFDMNLRTYNANQNILSLDNSCIPIFLEGQQILEVKFSCPLPEYLKLILSRITGNRSAISKFVFGQKYLDSGPWRDRIFSPF